MQKVIAKIRLDNIRKNAIAFQEKSGAKICAVVKADGYGHGAEEVAFALADIVELFAVAIVEEGLAIRAAACGKDILIFTPPTTEEDAYQMLVNGFLISVPNLYTARLLARVCETYRLTAKVHLKVNTGMNRYGMNHSALGKACRFLQRQERITVAGLYSHLYQTEEESAYRQRELFLQMQRICKRYFPAVTSHLGATYGGLLGKDFAFDMLRVGIGLYGYSPVKTDLSLAKAMGVEGQIVDSRKYSFGGAGYGTPRKRLERGTRLAVCRAGYADGFLRRRENGTDGFEKGVNDLCMDVCIRESEKKRGQYVPILTDADRTANQTDSIPYEVLCAATRRACRIYGYYGEIP